MVRPDLMKWGKTALQVNKLSVCLYSPNEIKIRFRGHEKANCRTYQRIRPPASNTPGASGNMHLNVWPAISHDGKYFKLILFIKRKFLAYTNEVMNFLP